MAEETRTVIVRSRPVGAADIYVDTCPARVRPDNSRKKSVYMYYTIVDVPADVSDDQVVRLATQSAMLGGTVVRTETTGAKVSKAGVYDDARAWTFRFADLGEGAICYPASSDYESPLQLVRGEAS